MCFSFLSFIPIYHSIYLSISRFFLFLSSLSFFSVSFLSFFFPPIPTEADDKHLMYSVITVCIVYKKRFAPFDFFVDFVVLTKEFFNSFFYSSLVALSVCFFLCFFLSLFISIYLSIYLPFLSFFLSFFLLACSVFFLFSFFLLIKTEWSIIFASYSINSILPQAKIMELALFDVRLDFLFGNK